MTVLINIEQGYFSVLKGGNVIMKKIMWLGFLLEAIALVTIILCLIFQKPILEGGYIVFVLGMLTCIISSFFVRRENIKENYDKQNLSFNKKNLFTCAILLIPLIILLIITRITH